MQPGYSHAVGDKRIQKLYVRLTLGLGVCVFFPPFIVVFFILSEPVAVLY